MHPARPTRRTAVRLFAILLLVGCAGAQPVARVSQVPSADAEPAEVLRVFVDATRERDFETVWRLLASPWRARYSPESLRRDFERVEQGALERIARAELAAVTPPLREGDRVRFEIATDLAVQLVLEPDGWKVEALE